MNRYVVFILGFLSCALLIKFCERPKKDDKIVTKTKIVKVTDTLKIKGNTITKYKEVFVRKTDTSIVYLYKPDSTSICANYYEQPIIGKRSNGLAKITTTGELLDFSAIIECQDSIKETIITKYEDRSRLFLSGEYTTNTELKIGLDYNIKNRLLLKGGVGYDFYYKSPYISFGVGVPLF